jgi:hypothetical protein
MDRLLNVRGQTLVELALVLPCLCLGLFMAVQLVCYAHNMIEIQRMAQVTIDRVSYENYASRKRYTRFEALWGRGQAPRSSFRSEPARSWRPFRGISTIQDRGRWVQARVEARLLPNGPFSRNLGTLPEAALAETWLEPPVPVED